MTGNYLRDKNGKFAGSVPSAPKPPTPQLREPAVPAPAMGADGNLEDQYSRFSRTDAKVTQEEGQARRSTIDFYDATAGDYQQAWGDYKQPALDVFIEDLPAGTRVLDAGCGTGRDLALLDSHGMQPVGIDLSEGMLREAESTCSTAELYKADLTDLPLDDESIGAIWASASILHLPAKDVPVAFDEFYRVLEPGGKACISVKSGEGAGYDPNGRFFTYFNEDELEEALEEAGFTHVTITSEADSRRPEVSWLRATAHKN